MVLIVEMNKMNNNYYFGEPDDSYDSVLNNLTHTEVHDCETSSIPLADFWHPRNQQGIHSFFELIGLGINIDEVQKCFEYPVFAEKNSRKIGKPSRTDVMLIDKKYCMAIEAKYTEKLYESIERWKNNRNKFSTKPDVLSSWYNYIKPYTNFDNSELSKIENEVVYQFLHRTASACYMCEESEKTPVLIYHLFLIKLMFVGFQNSSIFDTNTLIVSHTPNGFLP